MSKSFFTISDLFNLTKSVIYNPDLYKTTQYVSIDSRNIKKGGIFVAIKGENYDGHNFVESAIKNDAKTIIINSRKLKRFDGIAGITIVTVPDTKKTYGELARIKREKLDYNVVAITGSNGKTSTKDILATILEEKYQLTKTHSNNNNHIGVPLTILNANKKDEVLVLELGTNHFGEVEYISKIAKPNLALITNIGKSHIEFLKDESGVLNEKESLFEITQNNDGTILLNIDDKNLAKLKNDFKNIRTFGSSKKADYQFKINGFNDYGMAEFSLFHKSRESKFKSNLIGITNYKNIIAAISVALEMGLTISEIRKGIKKVQSPKGRFELIKLKNLVLIDDTYNSNPNSVQLGIENLKEIKILKKRILILGDMLELGKNSKQLHENLAEYINKAKFEKIFLMGNNSKYLLNKLKSESKHFENSESLISKIDLGELQNSIIYVKGSRGMKMEKIVQFIKEENK